MAAAHVPIVGIEKTRKPMTIGLRLCMCVCVRMCVSGCVYENEVSSVRIIQVVNEYSTCCSRC